MNFKEYKVISENILSLYAQMDEENDKFSKRSGLACVSSCNGVCCSNNTVAVPPADLLPLALHLIETDTYLPYLAVAANSSCVFFKEGRCSVYFNRATLCRLFAYSSVYNKQGTKTLSICAFIKEEKKTNFSQETINQAANIVDWSQQVTSLLPGWDPKCLPFNEALKYALEKVLLSYQYECQA